MSDALDLIDLNEELAEKEKEIGKLNSKLNNLEKLNNANYLSFIDAKKQLQQKDKEIDRLNNIINEYMNHLTKKMNEFVSYDGDLSKIYEEEFDYLDKLKELKEGK